MFQDVYVKYQIQMYLESDADILKHAYSYESSQSYFHNAILYIYAVIKYISR